MKRLTNLPTSWAVVCLTVVILLAAGVYTLNTRYTYYQLNGHTVKVDRWTDTETYTSHGYMYTRSLETGGRWEKENINHTQRVKYDNSPEAEEKRRQLLIGWEESKNWPVSKNKIE